MTTNTKIQQLQQPQPQSKSLQLHYTSLRYNYHSNYNYIATRQLQQQQLQLHCAASNHFSIHQWICSAMHDSQQPTSFSFPIFETSATALCGTYWDTNGIQNQHQSCSFKLEIFNRRKSQPQGIQT